MLCYHGRRNWYEKRFQTSPRTVRQQTPKIYEWHPSSHHGSGKWPNCFEKNRFWRDPFSTSMIVGGIYWKASQGFLGWKFDPIFQDPRGRRSMAHLHLQTSLGDTRWFYTPGFVRKGKKPGSHSVRGQKTCDLCFCWGIPAGYVFCLICVWQYFKVTWMLWCLPSPRQSPNDRRLVKKRDGRRWGIRGIGSQEWWRFEGLGLCVKNVVWCMYCISWAFFFFNMKPSQQTFLKTFCIFLVRFVGCFFTDSCFYNMFFWVWM